MICPEYTLANKVRFGRDDALALAREATRVFAARGKKVVAFSGADLSGDDDALAKVILGPTGNLRAPAIRMGKTLVVGFNPDLYGDLF